jgi:hypothetical protein
MPRMMGGKKRGKGYNNYPMMPPPPPPMAAIPFDETPEEARKLLLPTIMSVVY